MTTTTTTTNFKAPLRRGFLWVCLLGREAKKTYNTRMKKILICSLAGLLLGACSSAPEQHLVGADRDAHGCIASAGYTWSEAQASCVRVWEEGIRLDPADAARETGAAYVVLSKDGTQAELFVPVKTRPPLLTRAFTPDGPYWADSQQAWLLKRLPQGWECWHQGRLLYTAPNPQEN